MADEREDIRKSFKTMFDRRIPLHCGCYEVKNVDKAKKTCTIYIDEEKQLEVDGILLGFDKSGFISYPKPNSDVWVIFLDNTQTNGAVFVVEKTDSADIMGDEFSGIPKVEALTQEINDLKKDLNDLKTVFSTTWVPVPNDGGGALKAAAASWAAQALLPTQQSTIENDKVKHGKG